MSAEPEVSSVPLQRTDEFIVLCSDGVFDVFDNDQVAARNPHSDSATLVVAASLSFVRPMSIPTRMGGMLATRGVESVSFFLPLLSCACCAGGPHCA